MFDVDGQVLDADIFDWLNCP